MVIQRFYIQIMNNTFKTKSLRNFFCNGYSIKDGTSYIGKTLVHPDYQGKGIGTKMIGMLELINKAPRYEINTSIRCPQNIMLYERLGYVRFKETKTENNGFIYLEKK